MRLSEESEENTTPTQVCCPEHLFSNSCARGGFQMIDQHLSDLFIYLQNVPYPESQNAKDNRKSERYRGLIDRCEWYRIVLSFFLIVGTAVRTGCESRQRTIG